MNAVWSLTAATVTFVLVDFVYLVRELILELLSEVVLAAPPPSTMPTEASVNNTKKHT